MQSSCASEPAREEVTAISAVRRDQLAEFGGSVDHLATWAFETFVGDQQ
jgi:hypothetical protein